MYWLRQKHICYTARHHILRRKRGYIVDESYMRTKQDVVVVAPAKLISRDSDIARLASWGRVETLGCLFEMNDCHSWWGESCLARKFSEPRFPCFELDLNTQIPTIAFTQKSIQLTRSHTNVQFVPRQKLGSICSIICGYSARSPTFNSPSNIGHSSPP